MLYQEWKGSNTAGGGQVWLKTPVHPGSAALRRALRENLVSFPSQIPILLKRPEADMQWRMVMLFFVRGWSSVGIAERFGVPKHRIKNSLNEWSVRALALGYVQVVDPEAFAACCHVEEEEGMDRDHREPAAAEAAPVSVSRAPGAPAGLAIPPAEPAASPETGAGVVAALDVAIARCEEWRGEFWTRLATLLRDMRTAAAEAGGAEGAGSNGEGILQHELQIREEERVYHAVA